MKTAVTKKEFEKALARAMKSKFLIDTGRSCTVNFVIAELGGVSTCECWATMDAPAKDQLRVIAFGDDSAGEMLIINIDTNANVNLIGRGQKEYGAVMLVQKDNEGFSIAFNDDNEEHQGVFFLVGTSNPLLMQLITHLAARYFSNIDREKFTAAVELLFDEVNVDGQSDA